MTIPSGTPLKRRWLWLLLFLLCASVSMVGPTQALSGLVSRSLNALFLMNQPPAAEEAAQGGGPADSADTASPSPDYTGGSGASVASASGEPDQAWTGITDAAPLATSESEDNAPAGSNVGSSASSGGSGSGGRRAGASGLQSGSANGGGGGGNASGTGASSSVPGADGTPENVITAEELADMGVIDELVSSPASWSSGVNDNLFDVPETTVAGGGAPGPPLSGGPDGFTPPGLASGPGENKQEPSGLLPPGIVSDQTPASIDAPAGGGPAGGSTDGPLAPSLSSQPSDVGERIAAIPEPGALLLLAMGAAGVVARARRKRQARS
jgi:PEP-CTERM motif